MNTEQWIAFAEAGNQQRLSTQSGQIFQGWIMEITDDQLLISTGDGERGTETWLNLADIALDGLQFFDTQSRQWQSFTTTSA